MHRFNLVRPVEVVDFVKKFVGISGDFEEPLLHFFLFDFVAAAPTMTVFNLFVREDGLVDRAPPLVRLFLVGEPLFVKLQKAPLGPLIIFRVGSVDFAVPIDGVTEALSLLAEVRDVDFGDFLRGSAGFDSIIFRRETEGVVAERAHSIDALLYKETSETVDDGKVTNVANVEAGTGRVREHLGEHHLWDARLFGGLERLFLFPNFLPFCFDFERFVSIHNILLYHIMV